MHCILVQVTYSPILMNQIIIFQLSERTYKQLISCLSIFLVILKSFYLTLRMLSFTYCYFYGSL
jgi:hypothetical protein